VVQTVGAGDLHRLDALHPLLQDDRAGIMEIGVDLEYPGEVAEIGVVWIVVQRLDRAPAAAGRIGHRRVGVEMRERVMLEADPGGVEDPGVQLPLDPVDAVPGRQEHALVDQGATAGGPPPRLIGEVRVVDHDRGDGRTLEVVAAVDE
jgi:hypothetical protein